MTTYSNRRPQEYLVSGKVYKDEITFLGALKIKISEKGISFMINMKYSMAKENLHTNKKCVFENDKAVFNKKNKKKKEANNQNIESNDKLEISLKFQHNGYNHLEAERKKQRTYSLDGDSNNIPDFQISNNTVPISSKKKKKTSLSEDKVIDKYNTHEPVQSLSNASESDDYVKIDSVTEKSKNQIAYSPNKDSQEISQLCNSGISTNLLDKSESNSVFKNKKKRKRKCSFNEEIKNEIHSHIENGITTNVYDPPEVKKRKNKQAQSNENEENRNTSNIYSDIYHEIEVHDLISQNVVENDFSNKKKKKKRQRTHSLNGDKSNELHDTFENDSASKKNKKKKHQMCILHENNEEPSENQLQNLYQAANSISDESKLSGSLSLSINDIDYCKVKKKKQKEYNLKENNTSDIPSDISYTQTELSLESKLTSSVILDTEIESSKKKKKKKKHKACIINEKKDTSESQLGNLYQINSNTSEPKINISVSHINEIDSFRIKKKKREKYNLIENITPDTHSEVFHTQIDISEIDYSKKKKKRETCIINEIINDTSQSQLKNISQTNSNMFKSQLNGSVSHNVDEIDYFTVKKKKKYNVNTNITPDAQSEIFHTETDVSESKLNRSLQQDSHIDYSKKKKKKKKHETCIINEINNDTSENQLQNICQTNSNVFKSQLNGSVSHNVKKKKKEKNNPNKIYHTYETQSEIFDTQTNVSLESKLNHSPPQNADIDCSKKKKKHETYNINEKNKDKFENNLQSLCQSDSNMSESNINGFISNNINEIDYITVKRKKEKICNLSGSNNKYETQPEIFHTQTDVLLESKLNNSLNDSEIDCFQKKQKKKKHGTCMKNKSISDCQLQIISQANSNVSPDELKLNGSISHNRNEIDSITIRKKKKDKYSQNEKNNTPETQSEIFHTQADVSNLTDTNVGGSTKKKKKKKHETCIINEKSKDTSDCQFKKKQEKYLNDENNILESQLDIICGQVETKDTEIEFSQKTNKDAPCNVNGKTKDELESLLHILCQDDGNILDESTLATGSHENDSVKKKVKRRKNDQNEKDPNISELQSQLDIEELNDESKLSGSLSHSINDINYFKIKKEELQLQDISQASSNIPPKNLKINGSLSPNTHNTDYLKVIKEKQEKYQTEKNNTLETQSEIFLTQIDAFDLTDTEIGISTKKKKKKKHETYIINEKSKDTSECQFQSIPSADSNVSPDEFKLNSSVSLSTNHSDCLKEKKKKQEKYINDKNNTLESQLDIICGQVDTQDTEIEFSQKKTNKDASCSMNGKSKDELESLLQILCQNDSSMLDESIHDNDSFKKKVQRRKNQQNVKDPNISELQSELDIEQSNDDVCKNESSNIVSDIDNSISKNLDQSDESETNFELESKSRRPQKKSRILNSKYNIDLSPEDYKNEYLPVYIGMCKISNEADGTSDTSNNQDKSEIINTNEEDSFVVANKNDNMLNNVIKPESVSAESFSIEDHDLSMFDNDLKIDLSEDDNDSICSDKSSKSHSDDENKMPNKNNDMNVLKNIRVLIDFEIPPLHEIAVWSTGITKQQKALIARRGLVVKTGKFSKEEDEQIRENWKKFVKVHDLSDNPELFYNLNSRVINRIQKQNFLWFLSQQLPERIPYTVFARFRRLLTLAKTKKGRYTKEEDAYILHMIEKTKCKFGYITKIANHLGRPPDSVDNRISILTNQHSRKIRWKKNNLALFLKHLMKIANVDDVWKLKNRHISNVEFTKLSKKLDNVPIRILKCAWFGYIHHRLFMPEDSCDLRKVKFELVQLLLQNGESEWKTVNWNQYVKHFDGFLNIKLYQLIKMLVKNRVRPDEAEDLGAALKIISKIPITKMRKHIIYKLKYENNTITKIVRKQSK